MEGSNLPAQSTSFIGRVNELNEIADLLNHSARRLLTLAGPGGIGKTRLAVEAATHQINNCANGVFFVALAPISSPDLLSTAIANTLNVSVYGAETPDVQIVNHLREKHMLLVLDSFEHMLEATGLLSAILSAAPALKILVTSRERLNLEQEWVLALEGLPFPDGQAKAPLESYAAVQLFVQRARQVQAGFSIAQNAQPVVAICQQVEGMPLGLELAAT